MGKDETDAQGDPEAVLKSLETMLDEVGSARNARAKLLSGKAAAPAPEAPGAPPAEEDPRLEGMRARLEKARAGIVNRDARIEELRAERDALLGEIEAMRTSRSWRLTAPLRRLRGG